MQYKYLISIIIACFSIIQGQATLNLSSLEKKLVQYKSTLAILEHIKPMNHQLNRKTIMKWLMIHSLVPSAPVMRTVQIASDCSSISSLSSNDDDDNQNNLLVISKTCRGRRMHDRRANKYRMKHCHTNRKTNV